MPAAFPPSLITDPARAQAEAAWFGAQMAALRAGSTAGLVAPVAETGRWEMAQPRYAEASKSKSRRNVLGHSLACTRCSKSKMKCDGARPCSRCMQRGVADKCEDQEGVLPHAPTPPVAGAKSSQVPVASDIIDTPAGSRPKKQLKHAQACVHCSRSKVRCDGGRPCGRCVQRGLSDVCSRSREAASDGGAARMGAGDARERAPHVVGDRTPQNEGLEGLKLRGNGLGINGLSPAGAAVPQQSAVVGVLSQGSSTFARDASAAAGWGGGESGAGVAGGGLRLLSLPLSQQHLGAGGNASRTSALPLLSGEEHPPFSQTLLGMDSGVLPATLVPPRMDSLLEPCLQPMRSPFGTSQAPLARTPGSDRNLGLLSPGSSSSNLGLLSLGNSTSNLGLLSPGNSTSNLGLLSPGNSTSNLGLLSLGNSTSNLGLLSLGNSANSLGSISDILPNFPKVRSAADALPSPGITGVYSLGSSSSSLASCSGLFSVADLPPNQGRCSLGNSSSRLEGGGMGVVGAKPVCARQQGGALPVPTHGRSFDTGSRSEPSQLKTRATLVETSSFLGGASPDQSRGAEQGSRRCVATSDLYSDNGKDDADASGAAASASDSGPLIGEVDVTLPVERRCRLSLATSCRDVAVGRALVAAG